MQKLSDLEQKFLSAIPLENFELGDISAEQFPDRILSQNDARNDIAALAQMLINAYGGWPFHSKYVKLSVLNKLSRIYDSVTDGITAKDLHSALGDAIRMIPDNHIWLKLDKTVAKYPRQEMINVGENIIKSENIQNHYLVEKRGDVGIIALGKFIKPDETQLENFRKSVENIMVDTRAIIIDIRNNSGGAPHLARMITSTLTGLTDIPVSKRLFRRTTAQAQDLYKYIDLPHDNLDMSVDPTMQADNRKYKVPRNHKWAYNNPVYILMNNKSASTSERLVGDMKYCPKTILIGSHTTGCRQYINFRPLLLKKSGILIQLPTAYMEVAGIRYFETYGYKPDINCAGTDAYVVAMGLINQRN